MHTVAVAGHICVDLTPRLGDAVRLEPGALIEIGPLRFSLGGCVANVARNLAALGQPVIAYATVGDDDLGAYVRRSLPSALIDERISVSTAATTSYSLVIESGGDRTFWHHTGVNAQIDGAGIDSASVDLLHLGYPPLLPALLRDEGAPLVHLLRRVRAQGTTTSLDLAVIDPQSPVGSLNWTAILRAIAAESDVLSPSTDDLVSALGVDIPGAGSLDERFADLLISWGAAVVTVSSGRDGIVLRTGSRERLRAAGRAVAPLADAWADFRLRSPARSVNAVTTNGAGDAASAGLIYALSRGLDPGTALAVSTACSAIAVGGRAPSMKEVARLVPDLGGGTRVS